MDNRREFLKKAALLSGGAALAGLLPQSIQKALAIEPEKGSTWLDAEHIVILMQENRSFDHCFGTLQGVRGYSDPRAIQLPDQKPVWLQPNRDGETYAPFRLNMYDTKATWMQSLPHSWDNQVNARNDGKYNGWLDAKQSGTKRYARMPLTLGYHTREDLPFYYALADAFTVCDQHFCSSLTGTTPNRLYLWSGTIREKAEEASRACVWNEDADFGTQRWRTFPELLQRHGVEWKVYQNELSITGLKGDKDDWLANYTDNPLEFFAQYHPHLHGAYRHNQAPDKAQQLAAEWEALPEIAKQIHRRAFTTNEEDKDYHNLSSFTYDDGGEKRGSKMPAGDILHQFRKEVMAGELPAVSWLVAPQKFSDHPSAPWYGAWYVSEVMDILTQNPEVWKKTIFIVTYDENDGYFDHQPPFVAPHPHRTDTGKVSAGIDAALEYVTAEQARARNGFPTAFERESPIGLGFRVPLVIASPWSRGGWVNSQVFDHTSCLQLLEQFVSHKTGKHIRENNISEWRRTVCGNLSSVFRPWDGEKINVPQPVNKEAFMESVHRAQFKPLPGGYIKNPAAFESPQEKGIRPSCALPYELYADGQLDNHRKQVHIRFSAANEVFAKHAAGSPFMVYAPGKYKTAFVNGQLAEWEQVKTWNYAVKAGDTLEDNWPLDHFENNQYQLRVYGPNGFYRELKGDASDPLLQVTVRYKAPGYHLQIQLHNRDHQPVTVQLQGLSYHNHTQTIALPSGSKKTVEWDCKNSHGWYDFQITAAGHTAFEKHYAGRIETGAHSYSDPLMGGV